MHADIKRKRASASSLFLMELVVAILFFTLAASLCITIFVQAHLQSEEAKDLNAAVNICSDTAEVIRSCDSLSGAASQLSGFYTLMIPGNTTGDLSVFFDDNYEMISSNAAVYREEIHMTEEDGKLLADITFFNANDEDIYHLSITHTEPR